MVRNKSKAPKMNQKKTWVQKTAWVAAIGERQCPQALPNPEVGIWNPSFSLPKWTAQKHKLGLVYLVATNMDFPASDSSPGTQGVSIWHARLPEENRIRETKRSKGHPWASARSCGLRLRLERTPCAIAGRSLYRGNM